MKVLLVSDVLGKENNGTTIACMNLARYLQSQGDEVRFLCCDQDKKGVPGYYITRKRSFGPLNFIVEKNQVALAKPDKKTILQALEGVDIVHIMMPFKLGHRTALLAKKLGIPVTAGFHVQAENFTAHIGMMNSKYVNHRTYKYYFKRLYRHIDAIHYPTEFIHRIFEKNIKKKTNAYVISNGVNKIYQHQVIERDDKDIFKILFIGRISKEKSHRVLVEAVSKSKYKDKIQLYFAGGGPREKEVLKQADKLGIKKPIIQFMPREQLVKLINSCDLYCHPAEIEIEAISCLEAITCGLVPVISDSKRSATNGFALSEKNLFKNKDSQDLANKIDYWIEHPEEKEACSKEYLGYTRRFEQNACMEKMRKMLEEYAKPKNHIKHPPTFKKHYYTDELNDDFLNTNIKTKVTPDKYKYVSKNPFGFVFGWLLYYIIAIPLVFFADKIIYHFKIKNKILLKRYRLKGYYIYANHTSSIGDTYTVNMLSTKRNYIVAGPDVISIPGIKGIVRMLGAIPLPSNTMVTQEKFLNCIEKRIAQRHSVTIFPEAHVWPYCTFIRNFRAQSFRYPYDYDAPVFAYTTTWQKRRFSKKPRLVAYIDGPFYVNRELTRNDAIQDLRDRVYKQMVERSKSVEQVPYYRYLKINKKDTDL